MKRIILLLVFVLTTLSLFGQPKYEKSIEIGYQIGQSDDYKNYYGIEMINGVRFNDFLSCGIGVGFGKGTFLNWKTKSYKETEYKLEDDTASFIPIFGRVKVNLTRKKISPFIVGNLGYVMDMGDKSVTNASGIYGEADFGVDIPVSEGSKLYVMVGIAPRQSQVFFKDYNTDSNGIVLKKETNMVSFKIGYLF